MDIIYKILLDKINKLKKVVKYFVIGKSYLGKDIICFKLKGNSDNNIIVQGGMHAREYITSFLILEQINLMKEFNLCNNFYFIPVSNPDGVQIAMLGYNSVNDDLLKQLYSKFKLPYPLYKANAIGVDINTNFDAYWSCGKCNQFRPSTQNFVGYGPESESETQALVKITERLKPKVTLSYHSKGEVIYYGFYQKGKDLKRQKKYAKMLLSNYKLVSTKNSCGGYKDYNVKKYNNLSYTIEVGNNNWTHPIGMDKLKNIKEDNILTPLICDKF